MSAEQRRANTFALHSLGRIFSWWGQHPAGKGGSSPGGSIRTRLILGTGLILFLASVSALIGFLSLRSLQVSVEISLITASQVRELSLAVQNAFLLARQNEMDLLAGVRATGFDASASVLVTAHGNHLQQARDYLKNIQTLVEAQGNTSPGDNLTSLQAEVDALWPLFQDYETTFRETEMALRKFDHSAAEAPTRSEILERGAALDESVAGNVARSKALANEIDVTTGMIGNMSKAGLDRARNRLERISFNASLAITLSGGLAILFGILAAAILAREILVPIDNLNRAAQKMGQGELTTRVQPTGGTELIALGESFNSMARQLQGTLAGLEQRVNERTRDLQRRSQQLQAAAEISREAAATRLLDDLLHRAASLIRERFGFDLVRIFIVEETGQWAVLRANSNAAGTTSGDSFRLRIEAAVSAGGNGGGVVSQAAASGEIRLRSEVDASETSPESPGEISHEASGANSLGEQPSGSATFLPSSSTTQRLSEIAIPLHGGFGGIAGAAVIGVLHVQSREFFGAAGNEDTTILQIVADQLAVAIQNARLFEELQDRLGELETLYGHQSREAWRRLAQSGVHGYRFDKTMTSGVSMLAEQEFRHDIPNSTQAAAPLELPITVRGQVIGSLDVWPEAGTWTDEIPAMLEAIRDRLGQAIDSAQLFEEVQARASREQLLSQLTAHFTQSLDIDALLKGAVQELGLLPDVAEVSIQVGYPENGSPMKIAHREDAGTASGIDLIPEDR